jgi:hypothetical protein
MTLRSGTQTKMSHGARSTMMSFVTIVMLLVAVLRTVPSPTKRIALDFDASSVSEHQRSIYPQDVQAVIYTADTKSPIMMNTVAVAALPAFKLALLKPVLLEVGVLVLFQAVGFPVISKLVTLLPVRRLRLLKALSPKHMRMVRSGSSRVWKGLVAGYSKTSASKIVNRSKKIIKVFLPHDDVDEHHHQ